MKSCITCKKNNFNGGNCESKEEYTIFPYDLDNNDCSDYEKYSPDSVVMPNEQKSQKRVFDKPSSIYLYVAEIINMIWNKITRL